MIETSIAHRGGFMKSHKPLRKRRSPFVVDARPFWTFGGRRAWSALIFFSRHWLRLSRDLRRPALQRWKRDLSAS